MSSICIAKKIVNEQSAHFFVNLKKDVKNIMAEENVMAEVMNLLEAKPTSSPAAGPDIPALREQLAILVSSGKCKEAIGTQFTHEQVKRLPEKDVIRACKRYETYVGAKTPETLIEGFLSFAIKALGFAVKIKDADALQNDLKNDYIITKELSELSGGLALRCGRMLAVANASLITAKHVDFSGDSDGYPLYEVDKAEECSATPQ